MALPLFSKLMNIKIDGSTAACATDFSFTVTKDFIEVACLSSTGSKQQVPDLYGCNISGSGLQFRDSDITGSEIGLADMVQNLKDDKLIEWEIFPDVSTQSYFEGEGYFSSLSQEGGVGAAMSYSFEIIGTGDVSISTTV